MVWIRVHCLGLGCLFRLFSLVVAGWRCFHHESEQTDPIKKSRECPMSRPAPCSEFTSTIPLPPPSSHRFPTTKRAQTCNTVSKCFGSRSVSLRVSVLFHRFITCAAGETTRYCAAPSRRRECSWGPAVCVIVLLERKQRRKGVSHSAWGVFKVDPREHILVCRMNHQQGVAARCPPAPPAHVSPAPSPRWWEPKSSYNHYADCGMSSLCIQANLINQSTKQSLDRYLSINRG